MSTDNEYDAGADIVDEQDPPQSGPGLYPGFLPPVSDLPHQPPDPQIQGFQMGDGIYTSIT
jgi:hypothetical protein